MIMTRFAAKQRERLLREQTAAPTAACRPATEVSEPLAALVVLSHVRLTVTGCLHQRREQMSFNEARFSFGSVVFLLQTGEEQLHLAADRRAEQAEGAP